MLQSREGTSELKCLRNLLQPSTNKLEFPIFLLLSHENPIQ